MKKHIAILLLFVAQLLSAFSGAAITHDLPGGYAGDFLMLYIRSKYVSHKFGIPYLLPYIGEPSDAHRYHDIYTDLNLFYEEFKLQDYQHQFQHRHEIRSNREINPNSPTLYVLNHFFRWDGWGDGLNVLTWGNLLNDEPFLEHLRHKMALHYQDQEPEFVIPADRISVAVHVRTGRGLDTPAAHNHWPYKFPMIDYFVSQLARIAGMVNKGLYVHIFTDDIYPHEVANEFKNKLASRDIVFGYRAENHPRKNVLKDLLFMSEFDCLIRGMSHYSQIAQIIGKFKLVIHPLRFSGRTVVEVGTIVNDQHIMRDDRFKTGVLEELHKDCYSETLEVQYRTISMSSYFNEQPLDQDFN